MMRPDTHENTLHVRILSLLAILMVALTFGCHAEPDDVAGQAGELTDPLRRTNAISNLTRLYTSALEQAGGDRAAAGPHGVADLSVQPLTDCYIQNNNIDVANAGQIINLFFEMRDPRSLPALIAALDWRPEISEEHAIMAARTIRELTLDEAQKGEVINALGRALGRVNGARGADNRMRIEFIRTLGALRDARTTTALTEVMLRQSENQNFLINRLAAEQLGLTADPAAVPALIRALYIFDPANPMMRMNDVGAQALVRVGRPALQPLIDTLAGNNAEATQIATAYIAAVRQRAPEAAAQMTPDSVIAGEASYALGQLGFREAIDPLLREVNQIDEGERPDSVEEDARDESHMVAAALALVSINRDASDTARIREALITVYNRLSPEIRPGHASRPQILVAMQHFQDAELLPFLTARAGRPGRGEEEDPNVRILAFRGAVMLANASEAAALQAILTAEPEGDSRDGMAEYDALFPIITECNTDLSCWVTKLSDPNTAIARKACYMVARYGRGNADAVTALVAQIGHTDEETRGEVLYALDFTATNGSPEAVARIDQLREQEEGRAIWQHIESLALAIQARLSTRHAG
jgi:HEAT repeat protein